MVQLGKEGTLCVVRRAVAFVRGDDVIHKLFTEMTYRYKKYKVTDFKKKKINARYKHDHEWVQCDKCRKWRLLSSGYDIKSLPQEWFCYMQPFSGKCETPEQQLDGDVVTVGSKRTECDSKPK